MDGTQTPGINFNSIDGLTTVNATSISINGSTINLDSYVPYSGATSTLNLNAKILTNIADATALTDAVNLQTMNAKTYIGDATSYRVESLSGGNQNEYFILKSDYGSGVLCAQEDYTSKYLYGQAISFYTASPYFTSVGSITPVAFDTSLYINAPSRLKLNAPTVFISGTISSNGSQIKNVANGTLSSDVATVGQIPSLTGYVPYSGATSNVDLNAKQLKNIADGTLNNDAISLQQLNAKRYDTIENGAASVYVNCGLSNLTLQATAAGRIDIGTRARIWPTDTDATDTFEVRNFSGASKFYVDTTAGNRSQFTTALTVRTSANTTFAFDVKDSALTSLFTINTTTPTINCLTTTSMNSNKITNLANGTASGDAVNFGQLSTISSLITPLPAGSIQGSYIVYNGTSYVNNTDPVYLGASPGKTGSGSINIGALAGASSSTAERIAMGTTAGYDSQATNCIAIGNGAGNNGQLESAIAIGYEAGRSVQGRNSVAIGYRAGYTNQHASTIIINATGSTLNSAVSSATYVAPVRILTDGITSPQIFNKLAQYNTSTKELSYSGTTTFNVVVAGPPSGTTPFAYFMPTGMPIKIFGVSFTCTVVRNAVGDYTLTFPAGSNPNFSAAETTITTGVNASLYVASYLVSAQVTGTDTIRIYYVAASIAFTDLVFGDFISLRIEFNTP